MENSIPYSGEVTYKGHKENDRTDAIEIQYPDDWDFVTLFGLDSQQKIIENSLAPFSKPDLPKEVLRILPKGIILYGVPGTAKTTMIKNIAKKYKIPLIIMRADRILNLYLGESEKRVAEVFNFVEDFKKCIVLIDDGETLFPRRDLHNSHHTFRTMEQVLFSEIDDLNPTKTQIFIATNQKDMLDPALISRVSFTIEFEKPSVESIMAILKNYLSMLEVENTLKEGIEIIAEKLYELDGREISTIIGQAICNSLERKHNELKLDDFLGILVDKHLLSEPDKKLIIERFQKKDVDIKFRQQINKEFIKKEKNALNIWRTENNSRLAKDFTVPPAVDYLPLFPILEGKKIREGFELLKSINKIPNSTKGEVLSKRTHSEYIRLFIMSEFLEKKNKGRLYTKEFYSEYMKNRHSELKSSKKMQQKLQQVKI